MSLMTDLFGGSNNIDILTNSQERLVNELSQRASEELGRPADVYQGPTVAPRTSAMNRGLQAQMENAQFSPGLSSAMEQALSGAGDPEGVRSVYDAALGPAQIEFQRALNSVSSRYGDTFGASGALPEMMGRSTAEYGAGLNSLLANLTFADRNEARDRQANAIAPSAAAQAQQFDQYGQLYAAGEADRAVTGQEYESEYNKWLSGQWYNNPALKLIGPALGTQTHGIGESDGILPAIGGAAGGIGKLLAASDIRLKENVERVGETASGIPLYQFEYKHGLGPSGRYEGVVAQDLTALAPDAVAQMPNGYLGVYYDRIDADLRMVMG